jgi:hypothetical protein
MLLCLFTPSLFLRFFTSPQSEEGEAKKGRSKRNKGGDGRYRVMASLGAVKHNKQQKKQRRSKEKTFKKQMEIKFFWD